MYYASTSLPLTILNYMATQQVPMEERYRCRPDLLVDDLYGSDYKKELFCQQLNNASPFLMPEKEYVLVPSVLIDEFLGK